MKKPKKDDNIDKGEQLQNVKTAQKLTKLTIINIEKPPATRPDRITAKST